MPGHQQVQLRWERGQIDVDVEACRFAAREGLSQRWRNIFLACHVL